MDASKRKVIIIWFGSVIIQVRKSEKMNSDLVKQAQKELKRQGIVLSREQVFQKLVKSNLIDKYGNATEYAVNNGLVAESYTFSKGMQELSDSQDEQDITNVLSRLPQGSINYSDDPNLSSIQRKPLIKAIKDALKDGSLSKQGRLKWKKTLADIEKAQ